MGATHIINAKEYSKEKLEGMLDSGLDFAVEASGSSIAMINSIEAVRPRGGISIIVGNIHHKKEISINPREFNLGKRIYGTWGGNSNPDEHYPFYEKLMVDKKLDLSFLLNHKYDLDDINQALQDLKNGKITRALIKMND